MQLTTLQSWLVVVILFAGTLVFLYLASRPTWTDRRRHHLHQQHLDELRRHERARAAIARATDQTNVRINRSRKGGTNSE